MPPSLVLFSQMQAPYPAGDCERPRGGPSAVVVTNPRSLISFEVCARGRPVRIRGRGRLACLRTLASRTHFKVPMGHRANAIEGSPNCLQCHWAYGVKPRRRPAAMRAVPLIGDQAFLDRQRDLEELFVGHGLPFVIMVSTSRSSSVPLTLSMYSSWSEESTFRSMKVEPSAPDLLQGEVGDRPDRPQLAGIEGGVLAGEAGDHEKGGDLAARHAVLDVAERIDER